MNTHPEPSAQLGDATLHRCSGAGLFGLGGDTHFIVHQARGGSMKLGVREAGVRAEAELKVDKLPEVLRSLIARSGRTDLTLHQAEPPTTDDGALKITISADADPSRIAQAPSKTTKKEGM